MQTSYSSRAAAGVPGQLATPRALDIRSKRAEGVIPPGIIVVHGTTDQQAKQPAAPAAAGATQIIASGFATATTRVTKSGVALNGSIGGGRIWPPRPLRYTFNTHANWVAGNLVACLEDCDGNPIQEVVPVPVGGNLVVDGRIPAGRVIEFLLTEMGGTNGALTVGIADALGPISMRDVIGVALQDALRETGTDIADKATFDAGRECDVYVACEGPCVKGEPVYVRFVAAGAEVRGAVRADADGTDCSLLRGARFNRTLTAGGVVAIEIGR